MLRTLVLLAATLVSGCAARRPAPKAVPPAVRAAVGYTLGSPVDPSVAANAVAAAAGAGGDALVLWLEGYGLRKPPTDAGEPLAARGELVIDSVNEPFATAPPAAEAVRLVVDPAALPPPPDVPDAVTTLRAPLPPGCTAVVTFAPASGSAAGQTLLRVGVVAPAAGGAGPNRPRLLVTGQSAAPKDEPVTGDEPAVPGERGRERTLVLDWPLPDTAGEFALLFPGQAPPAANDTSGRRRKRQPKKVAAPPATVWRVRLEPAAGDAEAVQAAAHILAGLRTPAQAPPITRGALLSAVLAPPAAGGDASLRRALLSVCGEAGSDLASEAALLLEGKPLASTSEQVAASLAAAPADADTVQLGWLTDRAALAALAKLETGNALPPAGAAMLSARYGEIGRDVGALAELAAASATRADFDTRVRAENLILLDDASPASRVRAFEWMARRNEAPPKYDPLGPSAERRRAIDEYLQGLATAATQPRTQPATQAAREP
jgi:hypothetical protein